MDANGQKRSTCRINFKCGNFLYNGQLQEAFSISLSAIKLDENCADAYQCAANVCMSLSRYEDAIEYYQKVQIYIMLITQIEMNL